MESPLLFKPTDSSYDFIASLRIASCPFHHVIHVNVRFYFSTIYRFTSGELVRARGLCCLQSMNAYCLNFISQQTNF